MLQEKLLYLLEQSKGQLITGGELAKALGVSRTAIWKGINTLREKGHEIEALPNSGYRLLAGSDGLSRQSIADALKTEKIGQSLVLLDTVDSTNAYLKALDTALLPDGHTVIANEQTQGRGRLGRTFHSPAGQGIYLSVLLRPQIALEEVPLLTVCAALAVYRAIGQVCGLETHIKWVNDIFYEGKKLCGILTEGLISAEMGTVESVVVGIGVNTGAVAEEVESIAATLAPLRAGRGIRNQLAAEILNQLEAVVLDFLSGKRQEILEAYTQRLFIIGKEIVVHLPRESFEATAVGLDDAGSLLVRNRQGQTVAVRAGEVSLSPLTDTTKP
ncbi:biotin--[acetyl-CoA-carboxylase] ligase [Oscillospiraceae bacterium MB08-C2-2]|nr:biotin--[acetyl-CoA-carboxylase] ligase [Oscillospiraceae bacterium MB08-C2-2]